MQRETDIPAEIDHLPTFSRGPKPLRQRAGMRNNSGTSNSIGTIYRDTLTLLSILISQAGKSSDITCGTTPKWDCGKEPLIAFEQDVGMWMELFDIDLLQSSPPQADDEKEFRQPSIPR